MQNQIEHNIFNLLKAVWTLSVNKFCKETLSQIWSQNKYLKHVTIVNSWVKLCSNFHRNSLIWSIMVPLRFPLFNFNCYIYTYHAYTICFQLKLNKILKNPNVLLLSIILFNVFLHLCNIFRFEWYRNKMWYINNLLWKYFYKWP